MMLCNLATMTSLVATEKSDEYTNNKERHLSGAVAGCVSCVLQRDIL